MFYFILGFLTTASTVASTTTPGPKKLNQNSFLIPFWSVLVIGVKWWAGYVSKFQTFSKDSLRRQAGPELFQARGIPAKLSSKQGFHTSSLRIRTWGSPAPKDKTYFSEKLFNVFLVKKFDFITMVFRTLLTNLYPLINVSIGFLLGILFCLLFTNWGPTPLKYNHVHLK